MLAADNAVVAAEAMLEGEAPFGSLRSEGLAPGAELTTSGSINLPCRSSWEQVSADNHASLRAPAKSSAAVEWSQAPYAMCTGAQRIFHMLADSMESTSMSSSILAPILCSRHGWLSPCMHLGFRRYILPSAQLLGANHVSLRLQNRPAQRT